MNTIKIQNKQGPVMVGLNFTHAEFWNPAKCDFELYQCLPLALQAIRDFFTKEYQREIGITVTSTYRPNDPINFPAAHRIPPPAVDSVASDVNLRNEIISRIRSEFKRWEKSELVRNILKTGTNVLIIENTCLHLHFRKENLSFHPGYECEHFYIGEWGVKDGKQFNIAYS